MNDLSSKCAKFFFKLGTRVWENVVLSRVFVYTVTLRNQKMSEDKFLVEGSNFGTSKESVQRAVRR